MKPTPHGKNRRQFLQAAAASTFGTFAASAQTSARKTETAAPNSAAGSPKIPPSNGLAAKFWIDPSIAAWRPGPWRKVHIEYRQASQKVLANVLPTPLIQSDAHLSAELSLTHQAAKPSVGRKERYMVHIVNFSPVRNRATPNDSESHVACTGRRHDPCPRGRL